MDGALVLDGCAGEVSFACTLLFDSPMLALICGYFNGVDVARSK